MGHIAYTSIIYEMKEPRDFPKALALSYSVTIALYTTVAIVMYYYAGQDVRSPALDSTSPPIRKVAYAVAIPTIIIAGVIAAVVARNNIDEQFWRWRGRPRGPSMKRWAIVSLVVTAALLWKVAYIISEVIPGFSLLIPFIGAMFGGLILPCDLKLGSNIDLAEDKFCQPTGCRCCGILFYGDCEIVCQAPEYLQAILDQRERRSWNLPSQCN